MRSRAARRCSLRWSPTSRRFWTCGPWPRRKPRSRPRKPPWTARSRSSSGRGTSWSSRRASWSGSASWPRPPRRRNARSSRPRCSRVRGCKTTVLPVSPRTSRSSSWRWLGRRWSASGPPRRGRRTTVNCRFCPRSTARSCACFRRAPRSCGPAIRCWNWATRRTWRSKWMCCPATRSRSGPVTKPSWSNGAASPPCRQPCG